MAAESGPERSTLFVLSGQAVTRGLSLLRMVVVARILAPDQFGRFVLAMAITGGIELVSNPGLHDALVARVEVGERVWRTAYVMVILRGVALAGLLAAMAGPLAIAFDRPDLQPLLLVLAILPAIRSFTSLAVVSHVRDLHMAPMVLTTGVASLVETVVAIGLALSWRDASALAVAAGIGALAGVGASHVWSGARGFSFDPATARELLRFGRWRTGATFLGYLATQGDDLVVGRFLGTAPLGVYRAAYGLANLPASELSSALSAVAVPLLARTEPERLSQAYRRYLLAVSGVSLGIGAILAGAAPVLVPAVLGDAFAAAAVPAMIMALAGSVRAIVATSGQLLMARGRPEFDTRLQAWRAATLALALPLIWVLGIEGAAVASLLSVLVLLGPARRALASLGMGDVLVGTILRRLPASGLGGLAAWAASAAVEVSLIGAAAVLVAGGAGWGLGVHVIDRPLRAELLRFWRAIRVV